MCDYSLTCRGYQEFRINLGKSVKLIIFGSLLNTFKLSNIFLEQPGLSLKSIQHANLNSSKYPDTHVENCYPYLEGNSFGHKLFPLTKSYYSLWSLWKENWWSCNQFWFRLLEKSIFLKNQYSLECGRMWDANERKSDTVG